MLLLAPGTAGAQLERATDPAAMAMLDRGLALAEPAQQAERARLARACAGAGPRRWPGLELRDGKVLGAGLLQEIEGFAAEAGTTGGLGGSLFIVTTTADNARGEPVLPGSLRAGIEQARRERAPLWIVFSPSLRPEARIQLKQDLRPPDNVTLDGSCAEVMLETEVTTGCILLAEVKNVVLTRLGCRARDYTPEKGDGDHARSAFRLNGSVDRIAILHNDLATCGDGCLDITVSPGRPLPEQGRITVAFNRIADHNKVMLFGTFGCGQAGLPACDVEWAAANLNRAPALSLTLQGNLFLRTAQRHPRVYGPVFVHAVNNVFSFAQLRSNGRWGSAYGLFVSNTARALVERNLFIPLESVERNRELRGVWTLNSVPNGGGMRGATEGFMRLAGNRVTRPIILAENEPERVPTPIYASRLPQVVLEQMPPEQALACVAARTGRFGARAWSQEVCIQ